jgi:hypothetical protein
MTAVRVVAERLIDAPAEVVYHCLADYQEHHRPDGFLPPAFSAFQVERGGVGDGTVISFNATLGGRTRRLTQTVSEPQPGRVLVEAGGGSQTTFTVEPEGGRCQVRFETLLEANGLAGVFTRLFAPRLLRPLYAEELARLEQHAQRHPPLSPAATRELSTEPPPAGPR